MDEKEAKHVVVTGGGSGVGAAIAQELAVAGYRVTVMGRRLEALEQVTAGHSNIRAVVCDVASSVSVHEAFEKARDEFGPVAITIANAGTADGYPFSKMTADQWQHSIDVNLSGVFHCYKASLEDMTKAGWGRLIAIASTAGLKGYAYVSHYTAAKHGVVGLTKSLALECARTGVTVNAICPGFTETPMLERSIENIQAKTGMDREAARAALSQSNPMGRFIQPAEIVQTIKWLIGPNSQSITGQAISVSGGEV
ncbi:SDR family NAD(P)-dependent oxidoreductase [Sneathiella glossodoripedis]|uniref:SDR family NAD(P)-dependent oxidoreductase n=1 Tax=Sneathiella glossodoripedis TaxID=418853 RepID=UPI000471D1E2|nr:SDR family NAD(P)-dependent oxidoreductase [Sneathiella glossodoripedis]